MDHFFVLIVMSDGRPQPLFFKDGASAARANHSQYNDLGSLWKGVFDIGSLRFVKMDCLPPVNIPERTVPGYTEYPIQESV